jgi:hypothetical protein
MIAAILKFKQENPDRPVYAININGLDPSVAEPLTLEQLHEWWELPPGSLICIDECQEDDYFPLDRGTPEAWVKRISKVRHEGMDFWMTTQHPQLMSPYVRRLVDQHVHSVRKFNTSLVVRFMWGRCMDACEKGGAQKVAVTSAGALPKEVFDLYKSSNAHNMKRRIPLRAMMLPVFAVIAVVALLMVPVMLKRMRDTSMAAAGGAPVGSVPGADKAQPKDARVVDEQLRQKDYAKWSSPRIDGVPWSAPMFDSQQVRAVPRIACMAVDDGRCSCITEQGTHYVVAAAMCRQIAANGLYNPFLDAESQDQGGRSAGQPAASVQPQAPPTPAVQLAASTGSEYRNAKAREDGIAAAYVPPDDMPWNPNDMPVK